MSKKIIRTSLWFSGLSVLSSALNFLFYPVVARSLPLSAFGDVQIGVSFIMQAAALFTSLNTLALFVAAQKSTQKEAIAKLERIIIAASFVLALIAALFAVPISHALQLHNPSLIYMLSVIFILNIPAATWLGAVQGEGRFIASGVIATLSSVAKIVVGVCAIKLGLGAHGALFGILIGSLIILPLSYLAQRGKTLSVRSTFNFPSRDDFRFFRHNTPLLVLFGSLFLLAISSTVDVIAAKSALQPDEAGLFAQLSTAGKIPYFATVPIAIILFERLMRGNSRAKHLVGIFTTLALVIMAATMAFESVILQAFFGLEKGSYDPSIFISLCGAFTAYSIAAMLTYSLISQRFIKRALLTCAATLLLPVVMLIGASSSHEIASRFLIAQVACVLIALVLQYTYRNE